MRIQLGMTILLLAGVAAPHSLHAAKAPYLNAADFPSIQAAIDALGKQGGTVLIPPGRYDSTTVPAFVPPLRLPPHTPVRVVGAGREATNLESHNPNQDLCLIQADFQSVEQLTLTGAAIFGLKGRGNGVVVASARGDKTVISHAAIRDVVIRRAPRLGLEIRGQRSPSDSLAILCNYEEVSIEAAGGGAVAIGPTCTTQFFRGCTFIDFEGSGVRVQGMGHQFLNCDFEQGTGGPLSQEFVLLDGCKGVDFRNCWFEDQRAGTAPAYFVRVRARASHINVDECLFSRFASNRVLGILVEPGARSVTITNPLFGARDTDAQRFDPRDQITVRGAKTDEDAVGVTLVGGIVGTARLYYPVTVTDSLRAGERRQTGIQRVNQPTTK